LKRDLEYQEKYVMKYKEENDKLVQENEMMKYQYNLKEKD
jgi:hypothetical protein